MHNTRRLDTTVLLILAVLALLIGVLVPWWLNSDWDWLPPGLGTLGWIILAINGGLVICPWLSRIGRRIDFFEPIYFVSLLFMLLFFLRPIQILYDYDARVRFVPDDPQLFQKALLLGALGLISFYIGYGNKIGIYVGRKLPKFGGQWRYDRVVQIAVIYTLIGTIGYSLAVTRSGGFGLFLSTLQGRLFVQETTSGPIGALLMLIQVSAIILGTYYFKTKRLGIFFMVNLALAVGFSLLLGSRSTVLQALLTLLVVFYYLRSSKPGRFLNNTMVIGISAGVGIIFLVIIKALRIHVLHEGGQSSAIFSLSELGIDNFFVAFVREFVGFDWFVIVLDITPSLLSFQYGKTFLEFFLRFVPRALWPGKPHSIGSVLNLAAGGRGAGTSPSIVGELYLNFHVPGIIIGMVIFGILVRAMYAYLQNNRENPAVILLYAYAFASFTMLFNRSFGPRMFLLALFMIPLVLALQFIEWRKGREGTAITEFG